MHAERRVDIQVIAANAFIDDQHDILLDHRRSSHQGDRLPGADGVVQGLVGKQIQIGQGRVHHRQAACALTCPHEQHATEQQHAQHRRRHGQVAGQPHRPSRLERDAEQQQQAADHRADNHVAVLIGRLLDKSSRVHQRNELAIGQVTVRDPGVHLEKHR
ncbi:hypothetical protein D3C78_1320700 [compost metagenome]